MTQATYGSLSQWYHEGPRAPCVQAAKSAGSILSILEAEQAAGDVSAPAVPDLVLYQDVRGQSRILANLGAGRCEMTTVKDGFAIAAPDFAITSVVNVRHRVRSFALPMAQWRGVLDEALDGQFSIEDLNIFRATFATPAILFALRRLWSISADEGTTSRLLTRAAGCELFAALISRGGKSPPKISGGLAPWAERRCLEYLRTFLSEGISLDELASEVRLSTYHFARMFKQSLGVPPRAYLTQLRLEKACELLRDTELPITEIALEVGYSSNQALARVFDRHLRVSPTAYRRAVGASNAQLA